jgi:hypothetical protein
MLNFVIQISCWTAKIFKSKMQKDVSSAILLRTIIQPKQKFRVKFSEVILSFVYDLQIGCPTVLNTSIEY